MNGQVNLKINLKNLKLKNPLILSAGILGTNAELWKRIAENNAAAITTKSFSINPRKGHENPTVIELECGLLNAIGLANPGMEKMKEEMKKFKNFNENFKLNTSLIASIFEEKNNFPTLANNIEKYCDAIELDVSCPNVENKIFKNKKILKNIVKDVKGNITKPLIVKLSPNVENISDYVEAAIEGGCDMISAINTVKAMKIDINFAKPILANKFGGYSGKGIKPIAIAKIYEISKFIRENGYDVPVIGIGGMTNGNDVIEAIMAGASAVGIGTGIYYRNIKIFKEILNEIEKFMEENNYKSIEEMRGLAIE